MKPQLLLLHGALGSSAQFIELEKLLEQQFEIYKLDFSGHGKNELQSDSLSIELFSKDVMRFLDENKIDNIHIFGYSMGGFVALYLALFHPEKVNKIFTLATKFNWTRETAEAETKLLNPEKIKEKVPAFAAHLQKLHDHNWEKLMQQTTVLMLQLGSVNPLTKTELVKINKPVVLALGDKDKMVTLEETQQAQASIKNSSLHIFEDMLHPWELVNQKIIALKIMEFFSNPKTG